MKRKQKPDPLAFQMPSTPPWDYRAEGPYHVISVDNATRLPLSGHEFESPWEAMRWWWRFHVGPIDGRCVAVLDGHLQHLVGYDCENNRCRWFGCAFGFEILSQCFPDKPEIHLWESSARGVLPDDVHVQPL